MSRVVRWVQSLIRELRRRQVIRVAVVYATTGFVILQLAEILVGPFGLGPRALRLITLVLILGFPLAVGLAWVYNLTGEGVVEVENEADLDGASEKSTVTSNGLIVGLLVVAIGLLLYPRLFSSGEEASGQASSAKADTMQVDERSIAVLPFEALGQEKPSVFTEGMHDDLLTRLSNVSDLKVISRTSVEKYRDTDLSLPAIADSLGVRWIVEGGVQQADDQVQVNAQLIDPRSDMHRWADSYQRDFSAKDLFAIQGEIAGEITEALEAKLTPEEQERIAGAPTENLRAYRHYIQGRQALDQATSDEDVLQAGTHFRAALRQDSSYALAWAGLADAIGDGLYRAFSPDSVGLPEVSQEEAARRALELDPNLAEARAALGYAYYDQRNAPAALRELRRAVQLKPSYAEAHSTLSEVYRILARPEKALEHLKLANQLNPQHVSARHRLFDAYNNTEQHKKALEEARKQQRMYPEYEPAIWGEARSLNRLGRVEDAISVAEERLPNAEDNPERAVLRHHLTRFEAAAGDTARAREHLEALQKIPLSPEWRSWGAFLFAESHAVLGNVDATIEEFRKQSDWAAVPMAALRNAPKWLPALREDPRYEQLIREVNQMWGLSPDGSIPEEADVSIDAEADA